MGLFSSLIGDLLVQLGQNDEENQEDEEFLPIFTPTDGYNWMIAKTCFEAADFM